MARITVEDCLEHVSNRFELVALASRRARQIANGASPLLDEENDKPTVIALREIAAGLITTEVLDQKEQEKEEEEMAAFTDENEGTDHIAEEIKQMLSQNEVFESDENEDSDILGIQPGNTNSSSIITDDDDDEGLLG